VIEDFERLYGTRRGVRVYRAPGRVNLIGEHTDYNLGFVLPIAVELACFVAAAPSGGSSLRVFSEDHQEAREWLAGDIGGVSPAGHWSDYVAGVARELVRVGFSIPPQNLLIRSSVPEGAGLSSSAALEVACALALLAGRHLEPLELARLCRRAEVEFVGTPCGIMDQYVAVFGRRQAAIRIDCRSLEHEAVPLPAGSEFLAVNSMVKHTLAHSAYKQRTEECAAAVEWLQREFPEIESLRDISPETLAAVADRMPPVIARRARHVVTENERVSRFVAACCKGDLQAMGELLVASHRSLANDYEVSCAELNFLADAALTMDGVLGARLTGGGFGGSVVCMMLPEAARRFRERMIASYEKQFGLTPAIYDCRPSAGAGEIEAAL